jgi:hypothetical protein
MLPAAFGNSVKRLYKKSDLGVQQILPSYLAGLTGTLNSAAWTCWPDFDNSP